MSKSSFIWICTTVLLSFTSNLLADKFAIDTWHKQAFIQFKVSHFGFSYVLARFDSFKGAYCYDPNNPEASRVRIDLDVSSLNTGHAERDKHIRGKDYLNTEEFQKSSFVSTRFQDRGDGMALLTGDLSLHGVTRSIDIVVTRLGYGYDPWGKLRSGFEGKIKIKAVDYGLNYLLGEGAKEVEIYISLEGERSRYANIECS